MQAERKARVTGGVVKNSVFLSRQKDLRWSHFKNVDAEVMFRIVGEGVFPFLRAAGDDSTYSEHMKDVRFTVPTPQQFHAVFALS